MAYDRNHQAPGTRSGSGGKNADTVSSTTPGGTSVPSGTGARGTAGAAQDTDPTLQSGQAPTDLGFGGPPVPTTTGAPGSAGDQPGPASSAKTSSIGDTIYGTDADDHTLEADTTPRYDGDYPPAHPITGTQTPQGTGAGKGTVRGAVG